MPLKSKKCKCKYINRIPHRYNIGDKVVRIAPDSCKKVAISRHDPILIVEVFINGTYFAHHDTINRKNIRHFPSYHERSDFGGECHM